MTMATAAKTTMVATTAAATGIKQCVLTMWKISWFFFCLLSSISPFRLLMLRSQSIFVTCYGFGVECLFRFSQYVREPTNFSLSLSRPSSSVSITVFKYILIILLIPILHLSLSSNSNSVFPLFCGLQLNQANGYWLCFGNGNHWHHRWMWTQKAAKC